MGEVRSRQRKSWCRDREVRTMNWLECSGNQWGLCDAGRLKDIDGVGKGAGAGGGLR